MNTSAEVNAAMESLALFIAKNNEKTYEKTFSDWEESFHPDEKIVPTVKHFGELLYSIDENLIFAAKKATEKEAKSNAV